MRITDPRKKATCFLQRFLENSKVGSKAFEVVGRINTRLEGIHICGLG